MTASVTEKSPGNLAADEWYDADDAPPEDVTAGEKAPWGFTTDPETGERRPKKAPGRPKKPASAEELAAAPPVETPPDRPPAPTTRRRKPIAPADGETPMPKGGVIAAGVNKLYRRAGKFIRAFDYEVGSAVIACTRPDPEEPDELTVGEAWENLARSNPRVRAFLVRAITGGAYGDLLMAHAPIGLALFMKPAVQRLIPWGRLVESVAEPDEDTAPGEGGLPGGMTAEDAGEVGDLVSAQARRMAEQAARVAGIDIDESMMAEATAAAEQMLAGGGLPPGLRRQQPKRQSRAQRSGR